jgi:hypothetical protein
MAKRRRLRRDGRDYTEAHQMPAAFEGETVSRRRFMTRTTHTAGAVVAAAFTLPALGFAIGPVFDCAALIRADRVLVGPRFSLNTELRRFAPRDPGEPLDGIGQFLYPARPSTPPAPPGARS